jgi:hypothetical protein
MKKYCLPLLLLSLCALIFVGCSNNKEKIEANEVPIIETNEYSDVLELFKETYKLENINNYKIELRFKSNRDFSVFKISDKLKTESYKEFIYKNETWSNHATGEFDALDLFVHKDGKIQSLTYAIKNNLLNIKEVAPLIDEIIITDRNFEESENKKWAQNIIYSMKMSDKFPEKSSDFMLTTITNLFNLSTKDFDWAIAYGLEGTYEMNQILIIKYNTNEQQEKILNKIEDRKNTILEYVTNEQVKQNILNNERLYMKDNMIIWYCADNPEKGALEFLAEEFEKE